MDAHFKYVFFLSHVPPGGHSRTPRVTRTPWRAFTYFFYYDFLIFINDLFAT